MFVLSILAAVVLAASVIFLHYIHKEFCNSRDSRKSLTVPGLKPKCKQLGNLPDMREAGSLHQFLLQLHKQFGSIASFWMCQEQVVSIASAERFKEHISHFDRPARLFMLFEPIITSKSIQYANGNEGRSRRNHYDKMFSHDAIQNYYEKFEEITEEVIQKWNFSSNGDHIPLGEHMFLLAIKIALWAIVGRKCEDENVISEFRKHYDHAWQEVETRVLGDLPIPGSIRETQFKTAVEKFRAVIDDCLEDTVKNPSKEVLLLDVIRAYTDDRDVAIADVMTYITGAFHSTANHLTWCFYYLAKHKNIQDKLYREIKTVLGDDEMVSCQTINNLTYLRQVINETLRCAIVSPWGARQSEMETQLGCYKIPPNTPVIHAFGVSLHDEKYWPNPEKFDPERFTKANLKNTPSLAFSPFGFAGKRMCPAYRFSYAELSFIIVELIKRFEVDLVEGQHVKAVFGLVGHPADEIWVTARKRSG